MPLPPGFAVNPMANTTIAVVACNVALSHARCSAPTAPFHHDQPDKWRLPLENDVIPYRFRADLLGW